MNQILVTEKLYITTEIKRKKRLYKLEFFLSIFLVCILSSYYIYAEYNRNESEEVSQQILAEVKIDDTIKQASSEDDVLIIVLDEEQANEQEEAQQPTTTQNKNTNSNVYKAKNGKTYATEAIITIPSIKISYPVLTKTSKQLLEISVNKYWGPAPNEEGNYCIVGHNYRNGKMFGRLSELKNNDKVELEDLSGRKITYAVYDRYVVKPTDTRCTSQLTNGKKELTLITCTNYGKERLVVKCREI